VVATRSDELMNAVKTNVWTDKLKSFTFDLKLGFTQQVQVRTYYSWGDAISALGGIGASFKMVIGSLAGFFLFKFTIELADMIRRKNHYRYCKIIIEIYSRYLPKLIF
jgi:hypothetical protein